MTGRARGLRGLCGAGVAGVGGGGVRGAGDGGVVTAVRVRRGRAWRGFAAPGWPGVCGGAALSGWHDALRVLRQVPGGPVPGLAAA
jgi:hypothetical protein